MVVELGEVQLSGGDELSRPGHAAPNTPCSTYVRTAVTAPLMNDVGCPDCFSSRRPSSGGTQGAPTDGECWAADACSNLAVFGSPPTRSSGTTKDS